MPRLEEGIFSLLNNAAGVTALVGVRISPDRRKKGEPLPSLVYRVAYSEQIKTLAGPFSGLSKSDVQIIALASTRLAVRDLINACAVVFDGYSGETANVFVRGIILDGIDTSFFDPAAGENDGVYSATLTLRVMHGGT